MTTLERDLKQFTGTENYYFLPQWGNRLNYTDGVKYLAEKAGAYWLIDAVFSYQNEPRFKGNEGLQYFQEWRLAVSGSSAKLTCGDGNGNTILTQTIPFTDFPLPEITLWLEQKVLLLPSEH